MVGYCKKSEIEKIPTYLYFMIYLSAFFSEIFNASIITKEKLNPLISSTTHNVDVEEIFLRFYVKSTWDFGVSDFQFFEPHFSKNGQ